MAEFATLSVAFFLTCHRGAGGEYQYVGVKARIVNRKQVDVAALQDEILPAVLECANCSLHATIGGALSDTGAKVSLSTVPRLSLLSCRL